MKTVLTIAAALISTATLLGASSAQASTQGYDQYRRAVLGDTTVSAPAVATQAQLVPGSYAQYLIHNGAVKGDALSAAAQIGERPVVASVDVQARKPVLSAKQSYEKSIGNDLAWAGAGDRIAVGE
ncbi:hypothetical protein [Pelomonas sp. KK5]|uniref:hypothetical protein n=1 Tax=Pelomonas sp. KK5 TaxID=1855730 RepID=UPI00097CB0EB|nr:hypothetical protein [Pelomonas sp. KK5]